MEFLDKNAIYLQIAEHFIENILQKKWKEGERIPSVRETAVNYEVNPNTIMRTYNYLQDNDIIFNKRGIGYFVSDEAYKNTLEMKKKEFIREELPVFFKKMELLQITMEQLTTMYINYKPNKK